MAISTYKSYLMHKVSEKWEKLIDIKSFPDLGGAPELLETTTLSDDARTYIPGIRETSESFDFTANYDSEVFATLNGLDGSQKWSLTFSDGSGYTWKGSVSVSVNEGSVDAVLEMTISVTPSTVPVWKQGA